MKKCRVNYNLINNHMQALIRLLGTSRFAEFKIQNKITNKNVPDIDWKMNVARNSSAWIDSGRSVVGRGRQEVLNFVVNWCQLILEGYSSTLNNDGKRMKWMDAMQGFIITSSHFSFTPIDCHSRERYIVVSRPHSPRTLYKGITPSF